MAKRRMFSLDIVDTDAFLEMPSSTQALYFHLGMRADDDGFVSSPKRITAAVNCSADDMKLLIVKGFIIPFASGVCAIRDWKINNYLRNDRHTPTRYIAEKSSLGESNGIYLLPDNGVPVGIPDVNQTGDKRDTQYRLGKDSIVKGNIEREADKPPRTRFVSPPDDFPPVLAEAFSDWLAYKKERRETYKETGLRNLTSQIRSAAGEYGAEAVAKVIRNSIASNYQGIVFDRLERTAPPKPAPAPDSFPYNDPELARLKRI